MGTEGERERKTDRERLKREGKMRDGMCCQDEGKERGRVVEREVAKRRERKREVEKIEREG